MEVLVHTIDITMKWHSFLSKKEESKVRTKKKQFETEYTQINSTLMSGSCPLTGRQMTNMVSNFEYLLLLCFLTVAEF